MSKINNSEFPSLGAGPGKPEMKKPAGAWSRPPKILQRKNKISRQAELGGAWLARWEAYGDHSFALTTCGWVIDVIDRPIAPNPNKEARTFYNWFLEEIRQYGFEQRFYEMLNNALHFYTPKIAIILQEFRESPPEVSDDDAFKAHWFITLSHYQLAAASCDLALKMFKNGRRDIKQMTEELWQEIYQRLSQEEKNQWKERDQIDKRRPGIWSETLKRVVLGKMEEALRTIISWYQ